MSRRQNLIAQKFRLKAFSGHKRKTHQFDRKDVRLEVGQLEERTMFSATPLMMLAEGAMELDHHVIDMELDQPVMEEPILTTHEFFDLESDLGGFLDSEAAFDEPVGGDHDDHHDEDDPFHVHALPAVDESLANGSIDLTEGANGTSIVEAGLAALSDTFSLHSNAGASHTIYLDFDGHVTSGTYWNSNFNGGQDIVTAAYDFDGNASSFSDSELTRIQYIWQRVAEDFAPFDVNVTTDDPGAEALKKSGGGDSEWGVRVVIGGSSSDWYGNSAGGVAYRNSFNYSTDTPVFAFEAQLGNGNEKYTAEAISHEAGHALGLAHDGASGTSYYRGHGSGETGWAPIMGASYYENLTQWSRGEYAGATNGEDDLSIITSNNGFGYRADDHGDSSGGATSLFLSGSSVTGSGIIEQNTDVDVFSFTTDGGALDLAINAFERGANLDVLAELYDAANNLIFSSNPLNMLNATIDTVVTAGQYFLHVTGVGMGDPGSTGYSDYGSLGQYTISGNVTPSSEQYISITDSDSAVLEGDSGETPWSFTVTRSGDTSGAATVDYSVFGSGANAADAADFAAGIFPGGTVSFAAGESSKTITVSLAGDADVESNEDFTVQLSNASGTAQIGADSASGTIQNDDVAPPTDEYLAISAGNAVQAEGNTGSTSFTFTVTRSGDASGSTTVDYSVVGNGADAADFAGGVLPGGTVTFGDGEVSKSITIDVAGDAQVEGDESFSVELSGASGDAIVTDDSASGTILNDDVAATPGITVTPTSGLTTSENGSSASFNVVLDSEPTDTVVIDVVSLDATEGTVNKSQLVFSASNWDTAQTVIVSAVDDSVRDGHVTYAIQLTSSESNQGPYAGVDPDDVWVTNQDNEKGKKGGGGGNDGGGGGGGGGGNGKGKPNKGASAGDDAGSDATQLVDDFLSDFGNDRGIGRYADLNLELHGRERAAARLESIMAKLHGDDVADDDGDGDGIVIG